MNAYSMGISDSDVRRERSRAVNEPVFGKHKKERKATSNRQESLALSLHRKREGERLGRASWKRGAALVAGGTLGGAIIIALLMRNRKGR